MSCLGTEKLVHMIMPKISCVCKTSVSHMSKMSNKDKHGEVFTPPSLVSEMYEKLLEYSHFHVDRKSLKIFEPGAGKGAFFDKFKDLTSGVHASYIMNEINDEHFDILETKMKKYDEDKTKLIKGDVLQMNKQSFENCGYDMVVGNLPFNSKGKKFVPSLASKKSEGFIKSAEKGEYGKSQSITIWTKITHYCFENILNEGGYYYCIIPCIWLKPDNAGIYELFTQKYTLHYLKIYDCHTANKLFGYNCQTPICYVLVQKTPRLFEIGPNLTMFDIYDHDKNSWGKFRLIDGYCIPTSQFPIFLKHVNYFTKHYMGGTTMGDMVKKISCMRKDILDHTINNYKGPVFLEDADEKEGYKIITGSIFDKTKKCLRLTGFTCGNPGLYHGIKKIILPHKRLAKFVKDKDGNYGLSGRDMFVFLCDDKTDDELDTLYEFLNLEHIQNMITSGFRIRMNFIEKYVFSYIPWILCDEFNMNDYLTYINS